MAGDKSTVRNDIAPIGSVDPISDSATQRPSAVVGYLASVAMTAVATVVAIGLDGGATIPNLSLVFVVPVIIAGISFGLGPSLCSAVLGALAYNFFFTEPRYTLFVDDPANIWAIGLLFLVGLIVSGIAFTARRKAADAALLKLQMTVLQAYGRDIAAADNPEAIVSITSQALGSMFQVPAVAVLIANGEVISFNQTGGVKIGDAEFEAARSALEMGAVTRAGIYPAAASRFDFWPVATTTGQSAVIGLAFDSDERPSAQSIDLIGSMLALALKAL